MAFLTEDLFQVDPKGAFYTSASAIKVRHEQMLDAALKTDRELFTLCLALPGTAYAKARMIAKLLATSFRKSPPPEKLLDDLYLERDLILIALREMGVTRALKTLCSIVATRVNNARTRHAMLGWLLERQPDSLAEIALRFRKKVGRILRHCYGMGELSAIGAGLTPKDWPFRDARCNAIRFATRSWKAEGEPYATYYRLRDLAAGGKAEEFLEVLTERKQFPFEVALGFRNTYKLDVSMAALFDSTRRSQKQDEQLHDAAAEHGAEIEIDYRKTSLYDLWKLYFQRTLNQDATDHEKIKAAIGEKSKIKIDCNLGPTAIVLDCSRSMEGSPERLYHPLLVAATITSRLPDIRAVHYVGGLKVRGPAGTWAMSPYGGTDIAGPLAHALSARLTSVVVISDGYENTVKGLADYVLRVAREAGIESEVYHLNPVANSDGSARRIFTDVEPLVVTDVEYLKTAYVLRLIERDHGEARRLLLGEYRKLLGRGRNEVEFLLS